ncbi:MAG: hypothetical protein IKR13_01155 [Victivallales bacterium]|nr:hypothetical protein [Victivallales bacterium]
MNLLCAGGAPAQRIFCRRGRRQYVHPGNERVCRSCHRRTPTHSQGDIAMYPPIPTLPVLTGVIE